MHKLLSIAAASAAVALLSTSASMASVISFSSHAGGGGQTCYGNSGGTFSGLDADGMPTGLVGGDCVQITPHSAWKSGSQANVLVDSSDPTLLTPSPVWISYADTGIGGSTLATPVSNTDLSQPNMVITQSFTLLGDGLAQLRQWADDTVQVFIDGVGLAGADIANFSQDTCAAGSPGCQPGELSFGQVNLSAGDHTFTWLVWQVGSTLDTNSNPFGLLYIGQVTQAAVPEPGALGLLGIGLLGLVAVARRRRA